MEPKATANSVGSSSKVTPTWRIFGAGGAPAAPSCRDVCGVPGAQAVVRSTVRATKRATWLVGAGRAGAPPISWRAASRVIDVLLDQTAWLAASISGGPGF